MSRLPALTATVGIVAATWIATACVTVDGKLPVIDRSACEAEASRLAAPVEVRSAPATHAPTVASLSTGHFVYRCGRTKGWVAVMFPAVGEAVDCRQRGPAQLCATGWVKGEPRLELFG